MNVATAWLITWVVASAVMMYFGWVSVPWMIMKLADYYGVSMHVGALLFGVIWALIAVVPFLLLTREAMQ